MRKAICAVVGVLLVSSPAWAGITQGESFTSILNNQINLLQGEQTASSSNFATILNRQCATKAPGGDIIIMTPTDGANIFPPPPSCSVVACQKQIGFFNQLGSAVGQCALIGVTQNITGLGLQVQNIGDGVGPKMETQNLALDALQLVTRQNGAGTGNANQTMSIAQDQFGSNAAGPMSEGSVVFGAQATSLGGGPTSVGAAGSSLAVTTSQTQLVN